VACAEDPVGVFDVIFAGANDSGPKIPVESTKVAADCVTQFGPYALGAKVGKMIDFIEYSIIILVPECSIFMGGWGAMDK
jgi:hypothetical protein